MGESTILRRGVWIAALMMLSAGTARTFDERGRMQREAGGGAFLSDTGTATPAGVPGVDGEREQPGIFLSSGTPKEPVNSEDSEDPPEEALARVQQENGQASDLLPCSAVPGREPGIRERLREGLEQLFSGIRPLNREKAAAITMDAEDELVKRYVQIYARASRGRIQGAFDRCGKYRGMVLRVLAEYGLPEELVYLPVIESGYDVHDLSRSGALGLWQIMPERARALGLTVNCWIDERKDPEKSTRAAARYLKQLYVIFHDWHLALAAYNRGEYGLMRDMKNANCMNLKEARLKKAIPRETEQFVPQFIACVLVAKSPEKYGIKVTTEKPPRYDRVHLNGVVDLQVAAECAGTTVGVLRELNPALKARCTPYRYPGFELMLPPGTGKAFLSRIAKIRNPNPFSGYVRYRINRGDNIKTIVERFAMIIDLMRREGRPGAGTRFQVDRIPDVRPGKEYAAVYRQ